MFKPIHACGLLLLALAACGGGDDDDAYPQAVAKANEKQAQAQTLAADSPCTAASQCANLAFLSPTSACSGSYSYKPYSLVASSAEAASAAAAEQRQLASKAQQLAPSAGTIACTADVTPPPALACRASACQAQ